MGFWNWWKMATEDCRDLSPKSNEDTGNARSYLFVAVACALYILAEALLSLVLEGWIPEKSGFLLVTIVIFAGMVQVLRNKPKSLTYLGITSKIYFVVSVIAYAVSSSVTGHKWLNIGAWIYIVAVLYLAIVDFIPALRERASLPPVGIKGISIRAVSFTLPLVLLASAYLVWISTIIPEEIRSLRTVPYQEMLDNYGDPSGEGYNWNDQLNIYLKEDMFQKSKFEDGMIIWLNNDREMAMHGTGGLGIEYYTNFGYQSSYEFEKAIWNAGVFQMMPLIIKSIVVPASKTTAYHLETDRLEAIIVTSERSTGSGYVEFHAHPLGGASFTMNSGAPTLAAAVKPVILTAERLLED